MLALYLTSNLQCSLIFVTNVSSIKVISFPGLCNKTLGLFKSYCPDPDTVKHYRLEQFPSLGLILVSEFDVIQRFAEGKRMCCIDRKLALSAHNYLEQC